jgi:hypothetical protein
MDLMDVESKVIFKNGHKYELTKLEKPYDLTEDNNNTETVMTHKLTGFDEVLYLISEEVDDGGCFYWAYKVGNDGIYVNLMDEDVHQQANELLFDMLEGEGWE